MAVKIRLQPRGQKNRVFFWIVVTDSRNSANSGNTIEKVGTYDPHRAPAVVSLKEDRILYWLDKGAQPTTTTRNILSSQGLLLRRHLALGLQQAALTPVAADKKFSDWYKEKKKAAKLSFSLPEAAVMPTKLVDRVEKKGGKKKEVTGTKKQQKSSATNRKVAAVEANAKATEKKKEPNKATETKKSTAATKKKVTKSKK